tara:strand:+ start:336 stop:509 length:174 start_codon:yes stop_codon:yes gene_type:complete
MHRTATEVDDKEEGSGRGAGMTDLQAQRILVLMTLEAIYYRCILKYTLAYPEGYRDD